MNAICERLAGTRAVSSVPRDAERIGNTWKYVNIGGGPDRRYKNNAQLPIMRYGELTLTAPAGIQFHLTDIQGCSCACRESCPSL